MARQDLYYDCSALHEGKLTSDRLEAYKVTMTLQTSEKGL